MKKNKLLSLTMLVCAGAVTAQASVTFSTFISAGSINALEGQNNTIAITYAGNKFVGSVYFGANNAQLYSTDLSGGNIQTFGSPIPTASGEVVLGSSLGLGGFANGNVFAGSEANSNIYQFSNSGGAPTLFTSLLPGAGHIRQIFFDPGSSFGGKMIVTTVNGRIYTVDSAGTATLLANLGEDTEGMDIATSNWGAFAGQLLVASEGSGHLRFINSAGVVTDSGIVISAAETVSFVPLNLGASGNAVEGFYVANYPVDIQKAGASQFAGLQGHVIVTSEDGSNSRVTDLSFNGTSMVSNGIVGNLPNQSEDGIFVTADRIVLSGVPEPSSIVLLGTLLLGFGHTVRRRMRK